MLHQQHCTAAADWAKAARCAWDCFVVPVSSSFSGYTYFSSVLFKSDCTIPVSRHCSLHASHPLAACTLTQSLACHANVETHLTRLRVHCLQLAALITFIRLLLSRQPSFVPLSRCTPSSISDEWPSVTRCQCQAPPTPTRQASRLTPPPRPRQPCPVSSRRPTACPLPARSSARRWYPTLLRTPATSLPCSLLRHKVDWLDRCSWGERQRGRKAWTKTSSLHSGLERLPWLWPCTRRPRRLEASCSTPKLAATSSHTPLSNSTTRCISGGMW